METESRRLFLTLAGTGSLGLLLGGCRHREEEENEEEDNEVSVMPAEDLMQEHGVLDRVLLIYEEGIQRLETMQDISPDIFKKSADIIRRFIENYHEKQEEEDIFPRLEKAGKLTDLVSTLRTQHQAGHRVTDRIQQLATLDTLKTADARHTLVDTVRLYIRMYRPHASREDTVLFPAFRTIVTQDEYEELGEKFEKKEQQLFGQDGFERIISEVLALEKELGIDSIAQFTPAL